MLQTIKEFVEDKNLALIGVSKDKNKFGNILIRELTKKGYTVYPVHPVLKEAEGRKCYASIDELPDYVENLLIAVQPETTESIISDLDPIRIKRVWLHRGAGKGSSSPEAVLRCKEKGIDVVYGFCPMMFLVGTGVHKFHLWFRQKFGSVPCEFKKESKLLK